MLDMLVAAPALVIALERRQTGLGVMPIRMSAIADGTPSTVRFITLAGIGTAAGWRGESMGKASAASATLEAASSRYGPAVYVRFGICYAMFALAIVLAVLSYLPGMGAVSYAVMVAALVGSGFGAADDPAGL